MNATLMSGDISWLVMEPLIAGINISKRSAMRLQMLKQRISSTVGYFLFDKCSDKEQSATWWDNASISLATYQFL